MNKNADFPSIVKIRSPKFDLYEQVWLFWNGKESKVKIVKRWFDFDDDYWWYKVANDEKLYPESVFERSF